MLNAEIEAAQQKLRAASDEQEMIRTSACLHLGITDVECGLVTLIQGALFVIRNPKPEPPAPASAPSVGPKAKQ